MAIARRRRRLTTRPKQTPARQQRPWRKRKLGFQQWLFNITLLVMAVLVVGFIISALTTRSGIELSLTGEGDEELSPLLTAPAVTVTRNPEDLEDRIEVEVLNGCGIPGVAEQFTNYLRDRGYDVVRFTNAQRYDYPRTLVVNRGSDFTLARLVAQTLGAESNAVENMPDPSLQLDVTVVLGQDYSVLSSYREIMSLRR